MTEIKTYYNVIRGKLEDFNRMHRRAVGGYDPIRNTDILAQNIVKALGKDFNDPIDSLPSEK